MRALLTGPAGFVGQHLTHELAFRGDTLWGVDLRTYAATAWDEVNDVMSGRLHRGDVCDAEQLRWLLDKSRPDIVYHLAAESHVDASLKDPTLAMRVNGVGTLAVAMACAEYGVPLLYCSTDEVYGDVAGTPWETYGASEDVLLSPSSPYSAGKAAGEHAVRAVVRSFGLQARITRGCNAWGLGQYPEKLVPIACKLAQQNKRIPLHGGGQQRRQWVHVEEFAHALAIVGRDMVGSSQQFNVYNIAGPVLETVETTVSRIVSVAGAGEAYVAGERPGQDMAYHVSGEKMREDLGFVATRRIDDYDEVVRLIAEYQPGEVSLAHVSDHR